MKIIPIFAENLFACHFDDKMDNEYERLMDLWTDVNYLQTFAKKNKIEDVYSFIEEVLRDAEEIQDFLDNISSKEQVFEHYFQPLQNSENGDRVLALQKGKLRKNRLRLYAVKIDSNCFVLTGGAIKMSLKMEDHPDTKQELVKLKKVRLYLNLNGVFDEDSFFELLSEDYD